MKPFQGCYYLGAYRALSSVSDAFLLIHSVSGCAWGALALHQMGRQQNIAQACTMIHERELIFGGEGKLRNALEILKKHSPARAFVLNGCVPDMIGDDIDGVIAEAACPFPVFRLNTAGYCGSMRRGYLDALCHLAGLLPAKRARPAGARPRVNLIGISGDDFRAEADLCAIRRMLEPEVQLNAALPMLDAQGWAHFADADLNLVFRGCERVGRILKARTSIDYLVVDYPYGLAVSADFLRAVDAALGVRHEERIARERARARETIARVLHPLRLIYQAEAAIAGDALRAEAMRRFLTGELGLRVTAFRTDANETGDPDEWLRGVRDSGCVLLFGSGFEREIEDEAPVRLIRFSYPVMDAVALGPQPYAGFEGLPFLLSDILNALMTLPYRRHGRFNP